MLSGLAGSTHYVLTAVTLVCDGVETAHSFCEKTDVRASIVLLPTVVLSAKESPRENNFSVEASDGNTRLDIATMEVTTIPAKHRP